MPRVTHVKKARKDNPVCKAGESYYWWKFRFGGKHFSLTYPKQSQLTQSPYLSVIYDCADTWSEIADPQGFEALFADKENLVSSLGQVADTMEGVEQDLRQLVDQYEESASNMEEYFDGAERIDQLRDCGTECDATCDEITTMVDEIRSTADEIDSLDEPDDTKESEEYEDEVEEWNNGAQDLIDALSFEEPNFDFHEL